MLTCCSNKLYSAHWKYCIKPHPLALVFAGSQSEAGSAHTCNPCCLASKVKPDQTNTIRSGWQDYSLQYATPTPTPTPTWSLSIPCSGLSLACELTCYLLWPRVYYSLRPKGTYLHATYSSICDWDEAFIRQKMYLIIWPFSSEAL